MMTAKCDRCHEDVPENPKLTSESEPYCSHCGYVFGTSVAPSSWVCEECTEVVLDHGGDERPWCETCGLPMSCCQATASSVHGTGTGIKDLDLGLALLFEAAKELKLYRGFTLRGQDADLDMGLDLLLESGNDILENKFTTGN